MTNHLAYSFKPGDFVVLRITGTATIYLCKVGENDTVSKGDGYFYKKQEYLVIEDLTILYQKSLETRNIEDDTAFCEALGDRIIYSGLHELTHKADGSIHSIDFTPG